MNKLSKKNKSKLIKLEFCYEGEEPKIDKDYAEHHIYVISGKINQLLKKAIEIEKEIKKEIDNWILFGFYRRWK